MTDNPVSRIDPIEKFNWAVTRFRRSVILPRDYDDDPVVAKHIRRIEKRDRICGHDQPLQSLVVKCLLSEHDEGTPHGYETMEIAQAAQEAVRMKVAADIADPKAIVNVTSI